MFRSGTSRIPAALPLTRGGPLDALRFLAAFCMVVYHYEAEAPVFLPGLHPVFARGYLATDFFLIVSGYVMGRIYGDRVLDGRVTTGGYFLRRASRVVPAHLMMVSVFVVFVLATMAAGLHPAHPEWLQWSQLPGQIFLLQAFGPFGGLGWNSPSWTLSTLLVCYLAFPALWRGLRRIERPMATVALGVVFVGAPEVAAKALLGFTIFQTPISAGIARAPLFVLGAALAAASEKLVIPPKLAGPLAALAFALACGLQAVGRFDMLSIALIALMVMAAGATPVRRPSKLLERAALIAFALFITNEFVRVVYFGAEHLVAARLHLTGGALWAGWFGGLACAVAGATAFHYLIDWPSQAFIKPWAVAAPGRLKRWAGRLAPRPDPEFDLLAASGANAPRVREIVLQIGPMPGAAHRRGLEGPSGLAWG
jgi:peptidoglycan/LPS O-acetylase OafA/YrhL